VSRWAAACWPVAICPANKTVNDAVCMKSGFDSRTLVPWYRASLELLVRWYIQLPLCFHRNRLAVCPLVAPVFGPNDNTTFLENAHLMPACVSPRAPASRMDMATARNRRLHEDASNSGDTTIIYISEPSSSKFVFISRSWFLERLWLLQECFNFLLGVWNLLNSLSAQPWR
jgi:hypothetical protein